MPGLERKSNSRSLFYNKGKNPTDQGNKGTSIYNVHRCHQSIRRAWLDAIMYKMNKEVIATNLWTIIRNLNQNLTTKVKTKDGLTREIKIKDSLRQGGDLSVAQYALLMDEISK